MSTEVVLYALLKAAAEAGLICLGLMLFAEICLALKRKKK